MTSFVDKPGFSNAQNAARVFILSYKHIGMVSLSYFENQILTLESLPMMSHDVRFYMKYSTVFSPVDTIIQTRIVLRVLPDNRKNFTKSREIENLNFNFQH